MNWTVFLISMLVVLVVGLVALPLKTYAFQSGQEMTKYFEGFRSKIYYLNGVPHIGYGFNLESPRIPITVRNGCMSKKEADLIFYALYIRAKRDAVEFLGRDEGGHIVFWSLTRIQQDILTDMAYNLGREGLKKFKILRWCIHAGMIKEAANEIRNSRWYRQTGRRGVHHAKYFAKGI